MDVMNASELGGRRTSIELAQNLKFKFLGYCGGPTLNAPNRKTEATTAAPIAIKNRPVILAMLSYKA